MPIQIPTYISRTAPKVIDRGGTSPAATGLPIAQGLQSVTSVLAAIEVDSEKMVGDAARLGEFVARKGQLADRLGALEESLAADPDHKTYFDRAKKGIAAATTEVLVGVNDPALKNALTEHVSTERDKALVGARHKARVLTIDFTKGVLEEDIDRNIKAAVSATDAKDLMKYEGNIESGIRGAVSSGILSAAHGEVARRGAREKIATVQAAQMADREPERFLSNHKEGLYKDVDPLRLEGFRRHADARLKTLETGENTQVAGEVAEGIWSRMGPVSDLVPVNLDQMEGEVSKLFAGNQERAKLARAVLREKVAAHDKGVSERRDANLGAVWQIHARGGSIRQVLASSEYDRLPGTDQAYVKDKLESLSRQVTREEKADRQEGWDAKYYEVSTDPDALAAMSADQFKALYAEVGPANWRRLDQEKRKLSSPEALSEAKVDSDLFKSFVSQMGYDISPRTEKGKAKLVNLKNSLTDALVADQRAKGRILTREEKGAVMRRSLVEIDATEPNKFLGFNVGSSLRKKRVIEVQSLEYIYVPPDYKERVTENLTDRGIPLTEENVARSYILMKEWVDEEIGKKEKTLRRKLNYGEKEELRKKVLSVVDELRKKRSSGGNK